MHFISLSPAILLVLASIGSARPAANSSVTTYDAILESSPAALARDDGKGNNMFLTKDNTCGKVKAGKNNGWYCDPMKPKGGACCSSNGYCGNGPQYCEIDCQKDFGHCDERLANPPKAVTKCGPKHKNKKCNNDDCCSANGFCGTNKNFCGVGCQGKFGKCAAVAEPEPVERRCGAAHKKQKCLGADCCSAAGYCGIGTDFCAVPQSCQRAFGRCDSDMFPIGQSTLTDPRPRLGKSDYGKYIMDCNVPGTVAMTFDDGPNVYTSELLDKLKDAGAKATFFLSSNNNGRQVDQGNVWPALVKRMVSEGHQVASHSWSHPHMNAITNEDRKLEMAKSERAIANIIGRYPTYMRPPYGQCDMESGCQQEMGKLGYHLVRENFDTLDWKNIGGNFEDSITRVKETFDKMGPDSHMVICQHDTLGASVQRLTPVVLDEIKAKGLKAVTLGECLGDDVANWYRLPGTGESWTTGPKTSHVDALVDEPAPEHSKPEHKDESNEEVELDMNSARTKPTLPMSNAASTLNARQDEDNPYEIEMSQALDEMAGRLISPEEIAADKNAKESPEDTKIAEAAADKCVLKRGNFCGKIPHFFTRLGCFNSAKICYAQMRICFKDKDAQELEDGCGTWSQICDIETIFCLSCGGKDQPECEDKYLREQMTSALV